MFKRKVSLLTLIAILAVTAFSSFGSAHAQDTITLKIFLGSVGDIKKDQEQLDRFTKANPNIKVETVLAPQSATDILGVIQQFLGAKSSDVDVIQFDTIWPGILAPNMVDLGPYIKDAKVDTSAFYPALYNNNIVDGKVVGVPWFTDAGLLYYRTDLLKKYGYDKPPTTWDELEKMATKIQEGEKAANKDFWGYVWQGNSYEGLTCDALEWQASNGGGYIVEKDGTISVNNPKAIAAVERAKGWIGKISPPGVTKYQEEDARGVFQAGNAAFMRNWPYAYVLGNGGADGKTETKVKGLFDVAPLPAGDSGKGAAALGGWQLGVSAYSKHPKEAAALVLHLTSKDEQKIKALTQSNLPTIKALYTDADIAKQIPFIANLVPVFENASPRPSTVTAAKYNDVSVAYFTAVHDVLTGKSDAKSAFADLEVTLKQTLGDKFKVGPVPASK
jgi:trehalose/maltose transport system substrate-binding protein